MRSGTLALLLLAACNGAVIPDAGPSGPQIVQVAAEPQRSGDPDAGYRALVNEGYVSCGVPWSIYSKVAGPAPAIDQIPGRAAVDADLPYNLTRFTTKSGVSVVSTNCLACHAGRINGQLVIGLGASDFDSTIDPQKVAAYAEGAAVFLGDAGDADRLEWRKWADRVETVAPYIQTATVGENPADNVAAVLFSHRDASTLAWSKDALLPLPPPDIVVPVRVPAWWRMKKKNAMFYVGAGRGDHARIMMTSSTLCTDSVPEAEAIDAYFGDVRAYIASIEPPPWPWAIDAKAAAMGQTVFDSHCASCHGTYGANGSYPNLIIPLAMIGTDGALATGAAQFAQRYIDWFSRSFYGKTARLEPYKGYYAPPLDGIWATAPYLHNGSVPTIAALLDSKTRPQFWTRSFDSSDYDRTNLGWNFTAVDHGQDAEPNDQVRVLLYDTTLLGSSNRGHTFGDSLSADERAALLEYLKTI